MGTVHRQIVGFSRVSMVSRVSRVWVRIRVSVRIRVWFSFSGAKVHSYTTFS